MDWSAVVAELGPRLLRYFRGAAFAPEEAADLVQETLIRLLDKVEDGSFDASRGHLAMYAFGIAHFVRLEARKRARLRPEPQTFEASEAHEDSEALLIQRETRQRLRHALAQLPSPQQDIFLLMIDAELTLEQAGAVLRLPLNTVKSHVHRGKARLRELLADERNS
jgi:RNA polymerase sigma-70 factor (ECF subfamily)